MPSSLRGAEALELAAVREALGNASPSDRIDADLGVGHRVRALRRLLCERAFGPNPVGVAAREGGVAPSVLCRRFVRYYGLTPRDHCRRVRAFTAAFGLLGGLSVAHAAFDVGRQDLNRVYRQFRRLTSEAPARCGAPARGAVE